MGLHEPFGHLQHKLWQKERPGVKLAVLLPTTKSRESTQSRCVQVEGNMPLESSQRELQVFLKLHPNRRFEQRVMTPQSGGSPNGTVSRLLLESHGIKSHSNVGAAKRRKEYYVGESGDFPRVRAVLSLVSPGLHVACPSTKGAT
jgi:hypothetical protein